MSLTETHLTSCCMMNTEPVLLEGFETDAHLFVSVQAQDLSPSRLVFCPQTVPPVKKAWKYVILILVTKRRHC